MPVLHLCARASRDGDITSQFYRAGLNRAFVGFLKSLSMLAEDWPSNACATGSERERERERGTKPIRDNTIDKQKQKGRARAERVQSESERRSRMCERADPRPHR